MSSPYPRYITLPVEVNPWDYGEITLEPINRILDPYVRGPSVKDELRAIRMEDWDNQYEYERQEWHDDMQYGKGLYDDEQQLRQLGYTGRVSPLERRYKTNNRYR